MLVTANLVDHIVQSRGLFNCAHLLLKEGKDPGQTVKHTHLHVIVQSNSLQGFFGKLTVLWNIIFGSRPMNSAQLNATVEAWRKELVHLA